MRKIAYEQACYVVGGCGLRPMAVLKMPNHYAREIVAQPLGVHVAESAGKPPDPFVWNILPACVCVELSRSLKFLGRAMAIQLLSLMKRLPVFSENAIKCSRDFRNDRIGRHFKWTELEPRCGGLGGIWMHVMALSSPIRVKHVLDKSISLHSGIQGSPLGDQRALYPSSGHQQNAKTGW